MVLYRFQFLEAFYFNFFKWHFCTGSSNELKTVFIHKQNISVLHGICLYVVPYFLLFYVDEKSVLLLVSTKKGKGRSE